MEGSMGGCNMLSWREGSDSRSIAACHGLAKAARWVSLPSPLPHMQGPGSAGIPFMTLCWAFQVYWPCRGLCGWENGLGLEAGEPRSCDPLCVALGWQAQMCGLYCADANNLCLHFHGDLCTVLCCKVQAYLTGWREEKFSWLHKSAEKINHQSMGHLMGSEARGRQGTIETPGAARAPLSVHWQREELRTLSRLAFYNINHF